MRKTSETHNALRFARICARSIWRQVTCVVRCGACASGQSNIMLLNSGTPFDVTPFTAADSLLLSWVAGRPAWRQGYYRSTSLQHVQIFYIRSLQLPDCFPVATGPQQVWLQKGNAPSELNLMVSAAAPACFLPHRLVCSRAGQRTATVEALQSSGRTTSTCIALCCMRQGLESLGLSPCRHLESRGMQRFLCILQAPMRKMLKKSAIIQHARTHTACGAQPDCFPRRARGPEGDGEGQGGSDLSTSAHSVEDAFGEASFGSGTDGEPFSRFPSYSLVLPHCSLISHHRSTFSARLPYGIAFRALGDCMQSVPLP